MYIMSQYRVTDFAQEHVKTKQTIINMYPQANVTADINIIILFVHCNHYSFKTLRKKEWKRSEKNEVQTELQR